jgi:hypothetical protein
MLVIDGCGCTTRMGLHGAMSLAGDGVRSVALDVATASVRGRRPARTAHALLAVRRSLGFVHSCHQQNVLWAAARAIVIRYTKRDVRCMPPSVYQGLTRRPASTHTCTPCMFSVGSHFNAQALVCRARSLAQDCAGWSLSSGLPLARLANDTAALRNPHSTAHRCSEARGAVAPDLRVCSLSHERQARRLAHGARALRAQAAAGGQVSRNVSQ